MAINERLIHTAAEAAAAGTGTGTGNQEEGLILHLDANDVDSYDGDGSVWYDISNHEFTPAVDPAENFNTVIYNTNSRAVTDITGVGFKPDLVWIKDRNQSGEGHYLVDSVRGISGGYLRTEGTSEQYNTYTDSVTAFIDDGFTVGADSVGKTNYTNRGPYVAWCFKAGGAPTATNTATSGAMTANSVSVDGELQSAYTPNGSPDIYPHKMSVNTDLGFSIVTYRGTSTDYDTYPHGLGQRPDLIITKSYAGGSLGGWNVVAPGVTDDFKELRLDIDHDLDTVSTRRVDHSAVDANVVTLGTSGFTNATGDDYVAYHFVEKRGVSKVGTYKGTATSGNKIYTGFRPAWVMIKNTSYAGSNWMIYDIVRDTDGQINKYLRANTNDSEQTASSGYIMSKGDGFEIGPTSSAHINRNNDTFLYLAFAAEKPDSLTPTRDDFTEGTVTSGPVMELDANDYSGSGNWLDSTSNDNDATVNGATYNNDGSSDYFDFDGSNDYLSFSQFDISNDGDFTVELWVNPDSTQGGYACIFDYGHGSSDGFAIQQNASTTNQYYIYSAGTYVSFNVTANEWTHLVVTASGTSLKVYKDGVEAATDTLSSVADTSGQTLNIGRWASGSSRYWNGQMAQVRLYSTALTGSEVKDNYDATKGLYQNSDLKLDIGIDYNAEPTTSDLATGSIINLQADEYESSDGSTWNNQGSHATDSTITGATHMTKFGTSFFRFDGSNDSVSTGISNAQNLAWTVEVWFRVPNDSSNHPIVSSITGSGSVNGFTITSKSNGDLNASFLSGEYNVTASNEWDIDVDHRDGKWHHLIMSWDGVSGNTLYRKFDGVSYNTVSSRAGTASSDQILHLAKYGGLSTTGKLDIAEFRLYSSNLTESQMTANYNARKELYELEFGDKLDDHDVTFNGTSLVLQNEELGDWVAFDGSSDYASVPNIDFTYRNGFTYEIWFRAHSNVQGYVCRPSGTGNLPALSWRNYSGWGLSAFHYTGSGGGSVTYLDSNLSTNKWYHAVFTADSSGGELYIDGVLTASSSTSTRDGSASGTFYIGNYNSSAGNNFDGDIGQFRLYKNKLTSDEVMQNYLFTKNDYPNNFHMTITNAVFNSSGYFDFDGNGDYMQNNDLSDYFDGKNEFAVSAWFKSSHTGSDGQVIWSFSDNTAGSTELACQLRSNQIQCFNRISGSHSAGPNFYSGSGMGNNAWHHVVYQGDSTGTKIYIDNTEITNRTFHDSTNANDVVSFAGMNKFSIGANDDSGSGLQSYFDGQISKLKVYDRTLTTSEIEAIYNEGE